MRCAPELQELRRCSEETRTEAEGVPQASRSRPSVWWDVLCTVQLTPLRLSLNSPYCGCLSEEETPHAAAAQRRLWSCQLPSLCHNSCFKERTISLSPLSCHSPPAWVCRCLSQSILTLSAPPPAAWSQAHHLWAAWGSEPCDLQVEHGHQLLSPGHHGPALQGSSLMTL